MELLKKVNENESDEENINMILDSIMKCMTNMNHETPIEEKLNLAYEISGLNEYLSIAPLEMKFIQTLMEQIKKNPTLECLRDPDTLSYMIQTRKNLMIAHIKNFDNACEYIPEVEMVYNAYSTLDLNNVIRFCILLGNKIYPKP